MPFDLAHLSYASCSLQFIITRTHAGACRDSEMHYTASILRVRFARFRSSKSRETRENTKTCGHFQARHADQYEIGCYTVARFSIRPEKRIHASLCSARAVFHFLHSLQMKKQVP